MTPKTDYAAWRFYFDIGQYVVAALVALYIYIGNRAKATAKDVKRIEERVTKLEAGSITKDDLGEVYNRVNDMSTTVSTLVGTMEGVKKSVDMITEFLLSKGGKE